VSGNNGTNGSHLTRVVNGRPTEPQVRALMEQFGAVERGTTIPHADLESALGLKRKDLRYRTVVSAWRDRMVREKGVYLEARAGVGYEALTGDNQMKVPTKKIRSAARGIFRGLKVAEHTPDETLSEPARAQKLHMLTRGWDLLQAVRAEARTAEHLQLPVSAALPRATA
jgi:hypothetical protein